MNKLVMFVGVAAAALGGCLYLVPGAEAPTPSGPPGWAELVHRLKTEDQALFEFSLGTIDPDEYYQMRARYFFWDVPTQNAWFVPLDSSFSSDRRWWYHQGAVDQFRCSAFGKVSPENWGTVPAQMWAEVRSGFATSTVTFDSQCAHVELPAWSNGLNLLFCFGPHPYWKPDNTPGTDLTKIMFRKGGLSYKIYIQDYKWGRPVPASFTEPTSVCQYIESMPFVSDLAKSPPQRF